MGFSSKDFLRKLTFSDLGTERDVLVGGTLDSLLRRHFVCRLVSWESTLDRLVGGHKQRENVNILRMCSKIAVWESANCSPQAPIVV